MKTDNTALPTICVLIVLFIFSALLMVVNVAELHEALQRPQREEHIYEYGDIMVTAAHIPAEVFSGYTLIYTDETNDKAYYILNSYKPAYIPEGSKVKFGNTLTGKVLKSEGIQLYIEPDSLDAVTKGISGSDVIYKDEPYAFVSALTTEGLIRCIYY